MPIFSLLNNINPCVYLWDQHKCIIFFCFSLATIHVGSHAGMNKQGGLTNNQDLREKYRSELIC